MTVLNKYLPFTYFETTLWKRSLSLCRQVCVCRYMHVCVCVDTLAFLLQAPEKNMFLNCWCRVVTSSEEVEPLDQVKQAGILNPGVQNVELLSSVWASDVSDVSHQRFLSSFTEYLSTNAPELRLIFQNQWSCISAFVQDLDLLNHYSQNYISE